MPSSAEYDYRPYLVSDMVYPTRRDAMDALKTISKEYPHTRYQLDVWGVVTASRGWPPVGSTPHADPKYAKRRPESQTQREAAGNPPFEAYLHAVVSAEGTEAHFRQLAEDGHMCGPVSGVDPRIKRRYEEIADRARSLPDDIDERFKLVAREKDEGGLTAWPDGPWVERPEDPMASLPARVYSTQREDGSSKSEQQPDST